LILDLELCQSRLIAFDPRELVAQARVFIAHVDQVDVIARNRRSAVAEMCERAGDGTDDCQKCGLGTRGEIAGMYPCRDQMKRQN